MADVKHIQPYQQRRLLIERFEREFPAGFITKGVGDQLIANIPTKQGSTRVFPLQNEASIGWIHRCLAISGNLKRDYTKQGDFGC